MYTKYNRPKNNIPIILVMVKTGLLGFVRFSFQKELSKRRQASLTWCGLQGAAIKLPLCIKYRHGRVSGKVIRAGHKACVAVGKSPLIGVFAFV